MLIYKCTAAQFAETLSFICLWISLGVHCALCRRCAHILYKNIWIVLPSTLDNDLCAVFSLEYMSCMVFPPHFWCVCVCLLRM